MNNCEFYQWFIDNNYQQSYKNNNFSGGIRAEKDPLFFKINYCPICGKDLKELTND